MDPPLLLLLLPLLHPRCILRSEAVDLEGMRGCHRKLWENVMEVIVKIEKSNTMTMTVTPHSILHFDVSSSTSCRFCVK